MCGLAFLTSHRMPHEEQLRRMTSALSLLKHRGPDDRSTYQCDYTTFGHTRLSILDLENSRQPMVSPDRRFVLTFNGEIYNYRSLAKELHDEWQFKTSGDTEVILAGLILHGASFIKKLEGMWSFVFWDSETRTALLSRDRTGKKPLHYYSQGKELIAASEIPALKTLINSSLQSDTDAIADYFRYGFCLPTSTFYQEIKELPPATYAIWSEGHNLEPKRYWTAPDIQYAGSYAQAKTDLRELMFEAVRGRLVSDVEVGCFLSGGIDSTIVAALASQLLPKKALKCFTMGFNDSSFDETEFAKIAAKRYGIEHHIIQLDAVDPKILRGLQVNSFGQPFADPSVLPTALIAEYASKHVKVVLSGDGSDEIFGGYERYRGRKILGLYDRSPKIVKLLLKSLIEKFNVVTAHHSRSLLKKLQMLMAAHERYLEEKAYLAPTYCTDLQYASCFPGLIKKGYGGGDRSTKKKPANPRGMMFRDQEIYMPQSIHAKVDRASMAHSVEVRSPFMDTGVIEFAQSLPTEWLVDCFEGKKILKDAFADIIPSRLLRRKKQGFGIPIAEWMKGELGLELEQKLELAARDLIDVEGCMALLRGHREGAADNAFILWAIYGHLLWQSEK